MKLFIFALILLIECGDGFLSRGSRYTLNYNSTVLNAVPRYASNTSSEHNTKFQVLSRLQVSVIWDRADAASASQQLVLLKMTDTQLLVMRKGVLVSRQSVLDNQPESRLLVLVASAPETVSVEQVWVPDQQQQKEQQQGHLSEMLRGAALVLFQHTSGAEREEAGMSGVCKANHTWQTSDRLLKTKTSCRSSSEVPADESASPISVAFTSQHTVDYHFSPIQGESSWPLLYKKRLVAVLSEERHQMLAVARPQFGNEVTSLLSLQFTDRADDTGSIAFSNEPTSVADALRQMSPQWSWLEVPAAPVAGQGHFCFNQAPDQAPDYGVCRQLPAPLLASLTKLVSDDSTMTDQKTMKALPMLLAHFRRADREQLKSIIGKGENQQLLSVLGATNSEASHWVAKWMFNWRTATSDSEVSSVERYLLALMVVDKPHQFIVEDMIDESQHKHDSHLLHQAVTLSTAALARSFCSPSNHTLPLCRALSDHMVKYFISCAGDVQCCVEAVRALKNLADPNTVHAILAKVQEMNWCSSEAVLALFSFPTASIDQITPQLEDIFFQHRKQYSNEVRLLVAKLLLSRSDRPCRQLTDTTHKLLQPLLERVHTLQSETAEFSGYLHQLVTAQAKSSSCVAAAARARLANLRVSNYNVLALTASSTVLSQRLVAPQRQQDANRSSAAAAADLSTGFLTDLFMFKKNLFRRGTFSAFVGDEAGRQQNVLEATVKGGSLSALMGSQDPVDQESESSYLQLELQLVERRLRPVRFFSSKSELIKNLMWGVGSSRTSAAKGSFLLTDRQRSLVLQNGLTIRQSTVGIVSFDLAGQVSVSLWRKDGHAILDTRGSFLAKSVGEISSPIFSSQMINTGWSAIVVESNIKVVTSEGLRVCVTVEQLPIKLIEGVQRVERVPGNSSRVKHVHQTGRLVAPVTFNLGRQNTQTCSAM